MSSLSTSFGYVLYSLIGLVRACVLRWQGHSCSINNGQGRECEVCTERGVYFSRSDRVQLNKGATRWRCCLAFWGEGRPVLASHHCQCETSEAFPNRCAGSRASRWTGQQFPLSRGDVFPQEMVGMKYPILPKYKDFPKGNAILSPRTPRQNIGSLF